MAQTLLQKDEMFAGYKVGDKMSENHNGKREVYRATNTFEEEVALIVFRVSDTDITSKSIPYEIKFCKRLNHPCFSKVLDAGFETISGCSLFWMTQTLVGGEKLSDIIYRRTRLNRNDCFLILSKLLDGLKNVCARTEGGGIYNISPDNIFVRREKGKILDVHFVGLSIAGKPCDGNLTFSDAFLDGRFRAPETKDGVYNHLCDIYSLGVVMLHMMFGNNTLGYVSSTIDIGCPHSDWPARFNINPIEYHQWMWKTAITEKMNMRLFLIKKATDIKSSNRFSSADKMKSLLEQIVARSKQTAANSVEGGTKSKTSRINRKEENKNEVIVIGTINSESPLYKALDDVAGMRSIKASIRRDFVEVIGNKELAKEYNITPPNGYLLYGPSGCGKTFIAEKVAQEAGLRYRIIKPSDLGSVYVHGSQEKIAAAFKEAEANAPMILIFDEFDAIAPRRDTDNRSNQANEVNEILTQLNNCSDKGLYVIALTNRPDMIDEAVRRKGRLDSSIFVDLPDFEARKELFVLELKKRPCDDSIDYDRLGNATDKYTCSDISYIVKETARRCFSEAIKNGGKTTIPLTTERLIEVVKEHHSLGISQGHPPLYGLERQDGASRQGK